MIDLSKDPRSAITTEEYFKNAGDFSVNTWKDKYPLTEQERNYPFFLFKRVAETAAQFEPEKKRAYWIKRWIDEWWDGIWRPAGSLLNGLGNPGHVSVSNCTTIAIEDDSLDGIFDAAKRIAKAAAYRQGLGFDISSLRPRNARVNNSANISTGSVSWLDFLNTIGNYVGQSGRIPAMLGSIKISHPDVEEFITVKSNQKKIPNANISVQITNDFMQAYMNDDDWTMRFEIPEHNEVIEKTVNARELMHKLAKEAWGFAEPGVQFIDTASIESLTDTLGEEFKVKSTNACMSGDMVLLTPTGYRRFDELAQESSVQLVNRNGTVSTGKVWSVGKKSAVRMAYSVGGKQEFLTCTPDHVWMTNSGEEVEARSMKKRRLMPHLVNPSGFDETFVKLGFIQGDGNLTRLKSEKHKAVEVNIGNKDGDVLTLFQHDNVHPQKKGNNIYTYYGGNYKSKMLDLQFDASPLTTRKFPASYDTWDMHQKASFLRGCFSANGYVTRTPEGCRIGYKATSVEFINKLKDTLLIDFNIQSYITTNKEHSIKWANGVYISKQSYDLNISQYTEKAKYFNSIGFVQEYKTEKLRTLLIASAPRITSVVNMPDEIEVYDFREPQYHYGSVNGFLAHNCSEKFMAIDSTCLLSSLNVAKVPRHNYDEFLAGVAESMTRFMDDAVEYELVYDKSPFPHQKYIVSQLREIGVGVTNLHGWLIDQNLGYDEDKGIEEIVNLIKRFSYHSWAASIAHGKEKGNAPGFQAMLDKTGSNDFIFKSAFAQRMRDEFGLKFKTMRNMNVMSIAPTGSISLTFPDATISTGIEPAPAFYYWKRSRTSGKYRWYFVIPDVVRTRLIKEGYNEVPSSVEDQDGKIGSKWIDVINKYFDPEKFKPAHFIDPLKKVEMMGRVAKYIDSSISVTYNLKEDVTPETVENIYVSAWQHGVKSVAVYRDKSREGIIEFVPPSKVQERFAVSARPTKIEPHAGALRPKELPCKIRRITAEGKRYIFMIGFLENLPYEIFGALEDDLNDIPKEMEEGTIIKKAKGKYALKNGEMVLKDISAHINNATYSDFTRMISTMLRHGVPIDFIVDQLEKVESPITSFTKGINRVLKQYVGEYYKSGAGKKCSVCGSTNLQFQEGCFVCLDCGGSKCS